MKKPLKGSPLMGSSTPPLAAGMQLVPIPLIFTWPLPASLDISWHLWSQTTVSSPRGSRGDKMKDKTCFPKANDSKSGFKGADGWLCPRCQEDVETIAQQGKGTPFTGLGSGWSVLASRTTECVPANTFADWVQQHSVHSSGTCEIITAGDDQPAVQHRSTLIHIFLRHFECHIPSIAPEMQCSLHNSLTEGLSQNLQWSPGLLLSFFFFFKYNST